MRKIIEMNRHIEEFQNVNVANDLMDEDFLVNYAEFVDNTILKNMDMLIHSILNVTNHEEKTTRSIEFLKMWIMKIPNNQITPIKKCTNRLTQNLKQRREQPYHCTQCNYQNTIQVVLNPQRLFMPTKESDQPKTHSTIS